MRTSTLVTAAAGVGLAAALALGAAAPALAGPPAVKAAASTAASDRPQADPLTEDELATLTGFLREHPVLARHMVRAVTRWTDFLAAHPAFATELERVKELPADERRAALVAWLAQHPQVRDDLRELRAERREMRQDLRELRRGIWRGPFSAS